MGASYRHVRTKVDVLLSNVKSVSVTLLATFHAPLVVAMARIRVLFDYGVAMARIRVLFDYGVENLNSCT